MKRIARSVANVLLWIAAGIGVACGALWLANTAGLVQPLVVVSGSMEPAIMTGDLVFATRTDPAEVVVGDVVTLPSSVTGKLVTHRVVSIAQVGDHHEITMKGDANEFEDGEVYTVPADGFVWRQALGVPGGGSLVMAMASPRVAVPLLVALVALIALSLLPPEDEAETPERSTSDGPADPVEPVEPVEPATAGETAQPVSSDPETG